MRRIWGTTALLIAAPAVMVGTPLAVEPAAANVVLTANGLIVAPAGSENFGVSVTVLPNGNIVVRDPGFDPPGGPANVGAVHLYDGDTLAQISTVTGSTLDDRVGRVDVTVLSNGNFVIASPEWDNPDTGDIDAGAATWVNAETGLNGVVSSANSLVGSFGDFRVGEGGVTALVGNGNYVVVSAFEGRGAVSWGNGTTGTTGAPLVATSFFSSGTGAETDEIGSGGITPLANGNYVVSSPTWNLSTGHVAVGNGATGTGANLYAGPGLRGGVNGEEVGENVLALPSGDFVVGSPGWNAARGAATYQSGTAFTVEGSPGLSISSANSLIGTQPGDEVGEGLEVLSDGDYVVSSRQWNGGRGAVTWRSALSANGAVSDVNSLVGSNSGDFVGGVLPIENGQYVVASPDWNAPGASDAGAVTLGRGDGSTTGVVSSANSLVGSTANDLLGSGGVTALVGGDYVINSPVWDRPASLGFPLVDAGAVSYGRANGTTVGTVTEANSALGSSSFGPFDPAPGIGFDTSITALSDGDYVVALPAYQDRGLIARMPNGQVGTQDSLGTSGFDLLGSGGVVALPDGNYVVVTPNWSGLRGAITWRSGNGTTGDVIDAAPSLRGTNPGDRVGGGNTRTGFGVLALSDSSYITISPSWDGRGQLTWEDASDPRERVVAELDGPFGLIYQSVTESPNGDVIVGTDNDLIVVMRRDGDNDGVANRFDNCPTVQNGDQTNTDGGGSGDACDTDDDNDGVLDQFDAHRTDASRHLPDIPAAGQWTGDKLRAGKTLQAGQLIASPDLRTMLWLSPDGNLAAYANGIGTYSSRTHGSGASRLVMQRNGRLELQRSDGSLVLLVATANRNSTLTAYNTGQVQIRNGRTIRFNTGGAALASVTKKSPTLSGGAKLTTRQAMIATDSRNRRAHGVILRDGFLRLYRPGGIIIDTSDDGGAAATQVLMNRTGAVQWLTTANAVVDATATATRRPRLVLTPAGQLQLRSGTTTIITTLLA